MRAPGRLQRCAATVRGTWAPRSILTAILTHYLGSGVTRSSLQIWGGGCAGLGGCNDREGLGSGGCSDCEGAWGPAATVRGWGAAATVRASGAAARRRRLVAASSSSRRHRRVVVAASSSLPPQSVNPPAANTSRRRRARVFVAPCSGEPGEPAGSPVCLRRHVARSVNPPHRLRTRRVVVPLSSPLPILLDQE